VLFFGIQVVNGQTAVSSKLRHANDAAASKTGAQTDVTKANAILCQEIYDRG
jgi:hypothetical protein